MTPAPEVVKPYGQGGSKKEEVGRMFDNIAPTYDLLNHGTSFGIDTLWRKKMIAQIDPARHLKILDVATGTADVAIQTVKRGGAEHVTGIDLSEGMLEVGRRKLIKLGLTDRIDLQQGDSENLPFSDHSFDAVTVAFGVRNFEDLDRGLAEMRRVLRPGGKLVVLEFSRVKFAPLRWAFNFYFGKIMPILGRLQSNDPRAYAYLFESVQVFPSGRHFINILDRVGFNDTKCKPLTFGVASIYTATA